MKDILNMMNSDHNAIDKIIAKLNGKSEYPDIIFHELKKRLMRHFKWEEQVLFPEFELNSREQGKQIIFILKGEHQHIQNVFIRNIEKQLNSDSMPDALNTLSALIEILQLHKEMEQDIFYPWFEKNLHEHKMDQMIEIMKNRNLFEIDY